MKESFTILRPDIRFDHVNIQFDVENHRYLICLLSSMRSKNLEHRKVGYSCNSHPTDFRPGGTLH